MTRLLAITAGALLFAAPAILNRYPILFSDTGGLLEMGLLPAMGWDKPFVYGPLIAAISLHLTLWLPVAAQTALLSTMIWLTQRAFGEPSPLRHLGLCLVLAVATAAPWFASTLMPDALTPIAALGLATTLGTLPRRVHILVTVITAIATAAHLSHLLLAGAMIAALTLLRRRIPWHPLASLVAALVFLLASNWIGHGRAVLSPYGSVFALARLIADGPARDYLGQSCPQSGLILCPWRNQLTNDSDQFLWDANSPFWSDPAPLPKFAAEASQIVSGTIRTYPLRVLRDAYRNTAHELVRVDLGDTLVPDYLADSVRPRLQRWYPPAELHRADQSRQLHGTLAPLATRLNPLHRATLAVAIFATAIILIRGLRTASTRADLAAILLIGIAANAFAGGALSTVHDRYEARLIWLILLPSLLTFSNQKPYPAARTNAS